MRTSLIVCLLWVALAVSGAYWIAVLLYCAAVMTLGRRLRRKTVEKSQVEFWLANRELPGLRLGISLTSGWLMLGWIGFGMYPSSRSHA